MIAKLSGTIERLETGHAIVNVGGVGYAVSLPLDPWEQLKEDTEQTLWIHTYVREDRLDLFAFLERTDRLLFAELIAQSGIGPRAALDICAVPRELLTQAVEEQDPAVLTALTGIGKKKAAKLLLELRNLYEKNPNLFVSSNHKGAVFRGLDQDAVAALTNLGYDTATAMNALKSVSADVHSTEERVAAALRSL